MERYNVYPEYRSWENNWIRELPKSWQIAALKHLCLNFVKDGPHETPKFLDSGIPFLSVDGIQDNKLVFEGCRYISKEDHKRYSMKCLPKKGDVLLGKAASVGKVAYVDTDMSFNVWSPLAVITAKSNHLGRYIYYCLQSKMLQAQCEVFSNSNTQKNLGMSTIDNLDFPYPSEFEAKCITKFLDHETAKIDGLINKQQQLIKLLKEKRQAVISHAVTKGLNSDAPMKDSGIEWLGEVPGHWNIKRLRYLGFCQNGINIGAEYFGSGYPFLSYGDAYKNEELPEYGSGLVESTEQDRKVYSVVAGDVIFTRTSETVEEIGFSSTCLKTIEDATFAGFLIRFRPKSNVLDSGFSKYYFRNILMRTFFIKEMNLVTRASLSQDLLKKLPVTLPPLDEQALIAEFLDEKSAVFEKLTENAESAIELMKERRTALISAAVTGDIDVRKWQASANQDAQHQEAGE
ncbi:restriction endonuclease subunit S [Vibrio splendidus]|uniref:restriction endonuclease subunit S n=1 Tax=Vibrio splendidus TaxID=29497 RepID=UPI000C83B405|nr:restriction endonuclease subunit S [Vibrio splendidus]PMO17688.1 hypothetical protein BCT15_22980 [Vibrio splendidus]